ncbi:MAG: STAS domain-containing protein [Mycobacterium sp.]
MNAQQGDGAPSLAVAQTWVGSVLVVSVSGDVDMLTAPSLAEELRAAARQNPVALIADLSSVDFLASAGMNVLIATHRDLACSSRFGVVADGPATSRPLKMIGIDTVVTLYRTLGDALTDMVS